MDRRTSQSSCRWGRSRLVGRTAEHLPVAFKIEAERGTSFECPLRTGIGREHVGGLQLGVAATTFCTSGLVARKNAPLTRSGRTCNSGAEHYEPEVAKPKEGVREPVCLPLEQGEPEALRPPGTLWRQTGPTIASSSMPQVTKLMAGPTASKLKRIAARVSTAATAAASSPAIRVPHFGHGDQTNL